MFIDEDNKFSELAIASNFLFLNELVVLMEQYILVMLFLVKSSSIGIFTLSDSNGVNFISNIRGEVELYIVA